MTDEQKPEVTDVGRALAAEMFSILVHPAPGVAMLNQYDRRLARAGEAASRFVPAASLATAEAELRDLKAALRRTTQSVAEPAEMPDSPEEQLKMLDLECTCEWERAEAAEARVKDLGQEWQRALDQLAPERAGREHLEQAAELVRRSVKFHYEDGAHPPKVGQELLRLQQAWFERDATPALPSEGPASPVAEALASLREQAIRVGDEHRDCGSIGDTALDLLLEEAMKFYAALRSQPTPTGEAKGPGSLLLSVLNDHQSWLEWSGDSESDMVDYIGHQLREFFKLREALDIYCGTEDGEPVGVEQVYALLAEQRYEWSERERQWSNVRHGNSPVAPAAEGEPNHPDVGEGGVLDIDAEMLINGNRRPFAERVQFYLNELLEDDAPLHVIGHIESECADYEKLIRDAVRVYGNGKAEPPPASPPAGGFKVGQTVRFKGKPYFGLAEIKTLGPDWASVARPPSSLHYERVSLSIIEPAVGGMPEEPASDAGGEKPAVCPTCSKDRQVPPYWCFDEWHPQNKPQPPPTETLMKALRDAEHELSETLRQHGVLTSANMDPSHRFFVALLDVVKKLADELTKGAKTK